MYSILSQFAVLSITYSYTLHQMGGGQDRERFLLFLAVVSGSYAALLLLALDLIRQKAVRLCIVTGSILFLFSNVLHYRYFKDPIHLGSLYSVGQLPFISGYIVSLIHAGDLLFLVAALIMAAFVWADRVTLKRTTRVAVIAIGFFLCSVRFYVGLIPYYALYGDLRRAVAESVFGPWDRMGETVRFGFLPHLALEASQLLSPSSSFTPDPAFTPENPGRGPRPNIFIIQIESLPLEVIGKKFGGVEATPYLNSLRRANTYFASLEAQHTAGGGTSDVDFSVMTSRLPPGNMPPFYVGGIDRLNSLPKVMKALGYTTIAYHANRGGFWRREKGFSDLGFDSFVSRENLPAVPGKGVLPDHLFFEHSLAHMEKQHTPLFAYLITLSSHGPYNSLAFAPSDKLEHLDAGDRELTNYLMALRYVDRSVSSLVRRLQERYPDHLILIYGDHAPLLPALRLEGKERVPLFILASRPLPSAPRNNLGNEYDIPALILGRLGVKPPPSWLGSDFAAPPAPR